MAAQPSTPTALQAVQVQPAAQNGEGPQALKAWWAGFKKKSKKEQNQGNMHSSVCWILC